MKNFQEKRVVTVFGYKIKLTCSAKKTGNEDGDDEEEGYEVDDREGDENDKEAEEGDI